MPVYTEQPTREKKRGLPDRKALQPFAVKVTTESFEVKEHDGSEKLVIEASYAWFEELAPLLVLPLVVPPEVEEPPDVELAVVAPPVPALDCRTRCCSFKLSDSAGSVVATSRTP